MGHQRRGKTVETSRHGRMRREEIPSPRGREPDGKRLPGRSHEFPGPLQERQAGVAFIEVTDLGLEAEGGQQPPAADAERDLLAEAHLLIAAVQFAGDVLIRRRVRRIAGIEQVESGPPDLDLPGAQPEGGSRRRDFDPDPRAIRPAHRRDRQLPGVVEGIDRLLRSVPVDDLTEIAVLIEQSHADHGHAEIARRLQLIARHVAQPARVDRQGLAQHVLHAEIGDAGQRRGGVVQLKPGRLRQRLPPGLDHSVEQPVEVRVRERLRQLGWRHILQHRVRVRVEGPGRRIEPPPHFIAAVVPGPAQVHRQFGQGGQAPNRGGRRGGRRGFGPPGRIGTRWAHAPASLGVTFARAAPITVCACSTICCRWASPRKLSA